MKSTGFRVRSTGIWACLSVFCVELVFSSALWGCRGEGSLGVVSVHSEGPGKFLPCSSYMRPLENVVTHPLGRHESGFSWLTAGTGEPGATLTFTFIAPCPRPVSNHIFLLTNFSLFSLVSVSLPLVTALLFLSIWMPFFPQWYSPGVLYSNSHREKVWFRCTAPSNAEGLWIRAHSCTSQLWTARWV